MLFEKYYNGFMNGCAVNVYFNYFKGISIQLQFKYKIARNSPTIVDPIILRIQLYIRIP